MTVVTIAFLLSFNSLPGPKVVRQWSLYAAMAIALPFIFQYSKSKPIDRFLGELSYPVYISHVFICSIVRTVCDRGSEYGLLSVAATLVGATVLYVGFQRPIERYRQRRACGIASRATTLTV